MIVQFPDHCLLVPFYDRESSWPLLIFSLHVVRLDNWSCLVNIIKNILIFFHFYFMNNQYHRTVNKIA